MGQYSEWLRYHDIEQQLQTELQLLESELAQLQAHVCPDNQLVRIDNEILHALASSVNGLNPSAVPTTTMAHEEVSSARVATTPETEQEEQEEQEEPETPLETISPALSAWSSLPNFGPENFSGEVMAAERGEDSETPSLMSQIDQPIPSTPHSEMALLPEDMAAFFEEYTQTDPQLELPWWLRNITSARAGTGSPIDQESIRTNRLVKRWLERWGRPSSQEQQQMPKEEHS